MIEVKDRIPTYPGRVRMTPVEGQPNTYDMVRADEPIEPGTPINKALFDSITGEVEAMRAEIDNTLFAISQRARVGDIAIGTEIALKENGIFVPFIKIANSYYDGAAGNLVIRKNCVTTMPLMNIGDTQYENSRADLWLNNDYFRTLDDVTQAVALEARVGIRVTSGGSSWSTAISRKVFLLSTSEYNLEPSSGIAYEGSPVAFFNSSQRRTALYDGAPIDYYTRSIEGGSYGADTISATGVPKKVTDSTVTAAGIRPVLFLPSTYEVVVGMPSTANVMATAEVI